MKIDVITLFPELFEPFREWSMIKKARAKHILQLKVHNLRRWAIDERGTVDDHPYGGGPGMIFRIEPIYNALQSLKKENGKKNIALLSAKGKTFDQKMAIKLSKMNHLIMICGHYEGVDERIRQHLVDQDISIGNYILSGGEVAAMAVIDAVNRLLPGVIIKENATEIESFSAGLSELTDKKGQPLIEFPQYTRPEKFHGWTVPKILLSGHHQEINKWRAGHIKRQK